MFRYFGVVVTRVLAILRITNRLVLEADLAFCRHRQRLDRSSAFPKARNRVRDGMLAVFRRHIDGGLTSAERFFERGIQDSAVFPRPVGA